MTLLKLDECSTNKKVVPPPVAGVSAANPVEVAPTEALSRTISAARPVVDPPSVVIPLTLFLAYTRSTQPRALPVPVGRIMIVPPVDPDPLPVTFVSDT